MTAPTFFTKQQLGQLTHGEYNPRFRPALRTGRHVILPTSDERTHGDMRKRIQMDNIEEGYIFSTGA